MKVLIPALLLVLATLLAQPMAAVAVDKARCENANSKSTTTYSSYQSARTAYDYCQRYGDTSGSGYGNKDCNAADSNQQNAKTAYDRAVTEQWEYCY